MPIYDGKSLYVFSARGEGQCADMKACNHLGYYLRVSIFILSLNYLNCCE